METNFFSKFELKIFYFPNISSLVSYMQWGPVLNSFRVCCNLVIMVIEVTIKFVVITPEKNWLKFKSWIILQVSGVLFDYISRCSPNSKSLGNTGFWQSKIIKQEIISQINNLEAKQCESLMGSTCSQDLQHNVENPPMTNYAISFDMLFSYAMLQFTEQDSKNSSMKKIRILIQRPDRFIIKINIVTYS